MTGGRRWRLARGIRYLAVFGTLASSASWGCRESRAESTSSLLLVQDVTGRSVSGADLRTVSRTLCEAFVAGVPKPHRVLCDEDRRALLRLKALSTQLRGACSEACQAELAAIERATYVVSGFLGRPSAQTDARTRPDGPTSKDARPPPGAQPSKDRTHAEEAEDAPDDAEAAEATEDLASDASVLVVTVLDREDARVVARREWTSPSMTALMADVRSGVPALLAFLRRAHSTGVTHAPQETRVDSRAGTRMNDAR
ncbi:MAG: hypothetical protein IPK13_25810 [Deltaproteobacteria bacterium]|nr:hypothetical protein [Deltaproteobacteria bacterium]